MAARRSYDSGSSMQRSFRSKGQFSEPPFGYLPGTDGEHIKQTQDLLKQRHPILNGLGVG